MFLPVEAEAQEPYESGGSLCEIKGFGFLTVDPIARASKGFGPGEPERVKAAVRFVLEEAQAELGIVLAERQKEAVRMVFPSQVSIITGGPGKGKATVLGVILKIFERKEPGKQVLLCAPTGRARKRLSESTGYPALTIHKALYLTGEETEEALEEDLMIVDEFTIADMWLVGVLFSRIKSGARLVLVGDVD